MVYTISFQKMLRFWRINIRLFFLFYYAIVLTGCTRSISTDVIGIYIFHDDEIKETLELKSGGVSIQQIQIDKKIYKFSGVWKISGDNRISLSNYAEVINPDKPNIISEPPEVYSSYDLYWNSDLKTLERDEGAKNSLHKVSR